MRTNILVVDDDPAHLQTLVTLLADWGHRPHGASDGQSAISACRQRPCDLILMDVRMPGMNGIDAMREIKAYNPSIPVIVMTAHSDVETAVAALKSGAYDYLTKPLDFDELQATLARALDHAALKEEHKTIRSMLGAAPEGGDMIGNGKAMRSLLDMLGTIAPSEATVLVSGESGTGKELAARLIHANSNRRKGPFVPVNCAALSEHLLESELFGHEKGAFTGADRQREGRFRAADNGTLFLDEVGEIPMPMQAKLLRAIQEREIQRVGGDHPVKVNVRILAATNRDLAAEVAANRFREDLYYRLNVVSVRLPPLRERVDDIPALAAHFLRKHAERNGRVAKGFTPGAMDRLLKHPWPGNVRELENTVERAVVLLLGEYVSERELPPALTDGMAAEEPPRRFDFGDMTLEEIERVIVRETLGDSGGNKSEAARRLGITRKTLLNKLKAGGDDCSDTER